MTQEEKAKAYDKALERAKEFYILCKKCGAKDTVDFLEDNFPELCEPDDEKIRKTLLRWIQSNSYTNIAGMPIKNIIAWLEKQGTSYTKRDVDDAFVEGMAFAKNELEKQKPAWSVEDTFKVQRICKYLDEAKKYYADITEVRECIDWLKSLKQRYTWKPSKEQRDAMQMVVSYFGYSWISKEQKLLESLYKDLKKL